MDCSLARFLHPWDSPGKNTGSFSRGSSRPRDWTQVSRIVGRRFTVWAAREDRWNHKPWTTGVYWALVHLQGLLFGSVSPSSRLLSPFAGQWRLSGLTDRGYRAFCDVFLFLCWFPWPSEGDPKGRLKQQCIIFDYQSFYKVEWVQPYGPYSIDLETCAIFYFCLRKIHDVGLLG